MDSVVSLWSHHFDVVYVVYGSAFRNWNDMVKYKSSIALVMVEVACLRCISFAHEFIIDGVELL